MNAITIALALVFAVAVPLTIACSGASAGQTYAKTALVTVDAARAAFLSYDESHQSDIVATSTSEADKHSKLLAYRKDRDTLTSVITDCIFAVAVAAKEGSTADELAAAKVAVADMLKALTAIGVKL